MRGGRAEFRGGFHSNVRGRGSSTHARHDSRVPMEGNNMFLQERHMHREPLIKNLPPSLDEGVMNEEDGEIDDDFSQPPPAPPSSGAALLPTPGGRVALLASPPPFHDAPKRHPGPPPESMRPLRPPPGPALEGSRHPGPLTRPPLESLLDGPRDFRPPLEGARHIRPPSGPPPDGPRHLRLPFGPPSEGSRHLRPPYGLRPEGPRHLGPPRPLGPPPGLEPEDTRPLRPPFEPRTDLPRHQIPSTEGALPLGLRPGPEIPGSRQEGLRPPGPPPGPPPEGAKPFIPSGLHSQGDSMMHKSRDIHTGHRDFEQDFENGPLPGDPVSDLGETEQNEYMDELHNSEDPPRKALMTSEPHGMVPRQEQVKADSIAKPAKEIPTFLLCPLCKELLLKPLVLPCFHAICGERCIPKLIEDGIHVWCPTCRELKATKCGVNFLKPAETFGKMSRNIRNEKRLEAIDKGIVPSHCTIEEFEEIENNKGSIVDDLTCQVCTKLFSLPLKLSCSHSICKFPCAYKMLKHNVKIVCTLCEKPSYCNDGVKGLPVDGSVVACLKEIKGDNFVELFEQKLCSIAEGADLQQKRGDGESVGEEELNKYRFQKVNSAEQRSKAIPSLLSLDMAAPVVNNPVLPPTSASQEMTRAQADPGGEHFSGADRVPTDFEGEEGEVVESDEANFQEAKDSKSKKEQKEEEEDEYIVEELPPEFAAMASAWAGPKRCRPPKNNNDSNEKQDQRGRRFPGDSNRGNNSEKFRRYEKTRDRNRNMDDRMPPGVDLPPKAPSLLSLDLKPPKAIMNRGRGDLMGLPPIDDLYPELEDELLLETAYRHGIDPYGPIEAIEEKLLQSGIPLPPGSGPKRPLGPPPVGEIKPLMGPPPKPMDNLMPDTSTPPPTQGIRPSVPGLNIMLNPVTTSIPSMLHSSGSGPPPIVNYGSPAITETVPTQAAPVQPAPALPAPGQLQAAPATLPVMDPSTIPTMSSAFEYQAHWTKFVQQTQAYYNNLYAAQGGTPAEAQDTINDYLAKCWAWYSAYTNLCLVNPEYKDSGGVPVKKEKQPDTSGGADSEEKGSKKDNKNKKKKKNKTKTKPAAEVPTKDASASNLEDKEVEELKIMLLKKQLELKVKHARNKSELRGLMNMKKLILEEEGEEKVEEIDEEEREKVKEAAKQKQLEREQEIERQEQERAKDREKEIQRLEQARIREREKERQREKERMKREMEEKSRREKERGRDNARQKMRHGDDHYRKKKRKRYSRSRSRSYSRSRSRSYSRSRSRSPTPPSDRRRKPIREPPKSEDPKDQEPKYIKITNLPDELKAVELKSFVEAFGRVLNCKVGKMQGDMMAVVQMASLADAMSCVRDMQGSHFKSKILDVKYMGNKPNLKSVEVSIPDVHAGPSNDNPKRMQQLQKMSGPGFGYGQDYPHKPAEIRHIWIGNLPWGTTEDEIMRFVYHHGRPLECRLGTSNDPSQRGLYAVVMMESYIDVLKCINSLHGVRYEGKTLDVKKMKY